MCESLQPMISKIRPIGKFVYVCLCGASIANKNVYTCRYNFKLTRWELLL